MPGPRRHAASEDVSLGGWIEAIESPRLLCEDGWLNATRWCEGRGHRLLLERASAEPDLWRMAPLLRLDAQIRHQPSGGADTHRLSCAIIVVIL